MTVSDILFLTLALWIAVNVLVLALGALRYHLVSRARRDEVVRRDVERQCSRDAATPKPQAIAKQTRMLAS